MTRYYVDVGDELATRLKAIDDQEVIEVLEDLVEEKAPPIDEVDHEELSAAEKKRRRLRRIRRHDTSVGERPDYDDE